MNQCQIYDNRSLNFFRAVCGFLALIAFLIQNEWLVLITGLLFLLGVFSMKLNFIYQLHRLISNKIGNYVFEPIQKDSGEIKFVYGFTAVCFLTSFFLIYYGKYVDIAWGLDLLVAFLTLLASFANLCLASLMYVMFKKVLAK
ncbi:MAG: DUF4395 family protein [Candidatus Staskawiczbacteria bacterium]|nr:DUF4395 family protein [Candidatus Staskawiczbacteria bacterium]